MISTAPRSSSSPPSTTPPRSGQEARAGSHRDVRALAQRVPGWSSLLAAGAQHIVVADIAGASTCRGDLRHCCGSPNTNADGFTGPLKQAVVGADVFHRVSCPALSTPTTSPPWHRTRLCPGQPGPRNRSGRGHPISLLVAHRTIRLPNQINNGHLPGVFRGLLDAPSSDITPAMLLAVAQALASVVTDDELNSSYIMPSVFHPDVHKVVAAAVRTSAGVMPIRQARSANDRPGRESSR